MAETSSGSRRAELLSGGPGGVGQMGGEGQSDQIAEPNFRCGQNRGASVCTLNTGTCTHDNNHTHTHTHCDKQEAGRETAVLCHMMNKAEFGSIQPHSQTSNVPLFLCLTNTVRGYLKGITDAGGTNTSLPSITSLVLKMITFWQGRFPFKRSKPHNLPLPAVSSSHLTVKSYSDCQMSSREEGNEGYALIQMHDAKPLGHKNLFARLWLLNPLSVNDLFKPLRLCSSSAGSL